MGSRRAKLKRGFGEISRLPSGRYRARYTGPDANRHSAPVTFVARIDAEGWLVEQERLISRGEWRPLTGQLRDTPILMGEYAALVVGRRRLRPTTQRPLFRLLSIREPAYADGGSYQARSTPRVCLASDVVGVETLAVGFRGGRLERQQFRVDAARAGQLLRRADLVHPAVAQCDDPVHR